MLMAPARRVLIAWTVAAALLGAGANAQELPAPHAWAALESGDASKAAAIFRDALDRSPRNAILHFGSAQASLALGRTDAAIASLQRAITYDPRFVQAMVVLAQVAYQAADLDLAVKTLEKAAALVPKDRNIATVLARWRDESALHRTFDSRPGLRFNVLFEGAAQKAIGERVASVLESAYWSVGKALDLYPGASVDVILYSERQFQDITRAPAWAGGGYDGRIRLPVGGALRNPQALDRVVTHEYVHAVVRSAAGGNVPAWINEGLASYLEPGDKTWAEKTLRRASGRIPLEDLVEGFGGLDGETALVAYAQSQIGAELLYQRLEPYVGAFLQLLGNGHTVEQALSRHGVQPDEFYAEWRKRLGMN